MKQLRAVLLLIGLFSLLNLEAMRGSLRVAGPLALVGVGYCMHSEASEDSDEKLSRFTNEPIQEKCFIGNDFLQSLRKNKLTFRYMTPLSVDIVTFLIQIKAAELCLYENLTHIEQLSVGLRGSFGGEYLRLLCCDLIITQSEALNHFYLGENKCPCCHTELFDVVIECYKDGRIAIINIPKDAAV